MSALNNLKVLDFSTLLPGPFATMMLADMGAEVLRIESPSRPDLCRELPPFVGGVSTKHASLNRNKRAISLDLKQPEAIALVEQLVLEYDIIVEQFRPGVMAKLGLGYDHLQTLNPALIYCSITGYGQTGPYRNRAGHDNNYLSLSGINGGSGRSAERTPIMGTQVADIAGGSLHGVIGILAAVNHRHLTGEGQHVDISMTDAAFTLNAMTGADYLAAGVDTGPGEGLLNGGSFYDYYATADGRHISVGSLEPQFFSRLCLALGGDSLLKLGSRQDKTSQQAFKRSLEETFREKTLAQWRVIFAEIDACVEPVLTFAEACEHEQLKARGMIVSVPREHGEDIAQIANPIKMSRCQPRYDFAGVAVGAHNEAMLNDPAIDLDVREAVQQSGALGLAAQPE